MLKYYIYTWKIYCSRSWDLGSSALLSGSGADAMICWGLPTYSLYPVVILHRGTGWWLMLQLLPANASNAKLAKVIKADSKKYLFFPTDYWWQGF